MTRLLMIRIVLVAAGALVMSSCAPYGGGGEKGSSGSAPVSASSLATFEAFTVTDLAGAEADAVAHSDELSRPCYAALGQYITTLPTSKTYGVGAFSAFQKARDFRHGVEGGLPNYVKLGCAALVMDEAKLIAELAAIGAAPSPVLP
jgi:hypothetical protein